VLNAVSIDAVVIAAVVIAASVLLMLFIVGDVM
jgi:hypothetical protein